MKNFSPLILSTLLLTSCSGPDSSGGVEFSKTANSFPFGDCRGSGYQTHSTKETGCGWITVDENNYYIEPYANLRGADLTHAALRDANLRDADLTHAALRDANLRGAILIGADLRDADLRQTDLRDANLSGANLSGVKADSRIICPNGKKWGTAGNDCPF